MKNPFIKKEETKALAVSQPKEVSAPITDELLNKFMKTMGIGTQLLPYEMEAYKEMAKMYELNPFKREIHVVAYGQGQYRTLAISVGYEVYLKKAEESGLMEYWDIVEASPETPIDKYFATLVVKRRDRKTEQKWTAYYSESFQTKKGGEVNKFWKKMPRLMTRKVAMSQGFRLFFEDVLHGIPYTTEELPDHNERDVTPSPAELPKETTKQAETPKTVEAPEAPAQSQRHFDDQTVPEEAEVVPVEPEIPDINYFSEIIAIVNKSSLPPMAVGDCEKGKMEYIKEAKEHINDQEFLKNLFEDLVRNANG